MKQIRNMTQIELAAYVQSCLQNKGINVVLSVGSAVSFYSSNKYVSKDLDLINANFAKRQAIKTIMAKIGFSEQGRYYKNPETIFWWSFPMAPSRLGRSL